jgi:hypothetical protein
MRPLLLALVAATALADDATPIARPSMRQLPEGGLPQPPSDRALVDARKELKARFRGLLARTDSAAGATLACDALYSSAITEPDAALKWLMLAESRRFAIDTGRADCISRAIALASAGYDFDALTLELESLGEIPLRALDAQKTVQFATAAEKLATRAEADGDEATAQSAWLLAFRSWQRCGNIDAARRAESRIK